MAIRVPEALSPGNNDGVNDLWEIRGDTYGSAGLEQYPNSQVTINNRSGQLIYQNNNYCNNWDGRNNQHQLLPSGTYYWTLKLGISGETLTGFVLILY